MDFIEPCFGIGHNLSLICQMTSEDIKHQLIIINGATEEGFTLLIPEKIIKNKNKGGGGGGGHS